LEIFVISIVESIDAMARRSKEYGADQTRNNANERDRHKDAKDNE
jgi:hypothetical protein